MKHTLFRLLLWIGLPGLLLLLLLWVLPIGIKYAAQQWLTDQGMQAEIADIDLNLFTATAAIHNARSSNAEGRGFQLEQINIGWRYIPLFKKRIQLSALSIQGLQLDIAHNETTGNRLEIAGLAPAREEDKSTSNNEWGFGLDSIQITSSTLTYIAPQLKQSIKLQASSASDIATWADDQPIVINTQAAVADGELVLQGQVQPFGQTLKATLRLQAKALPLATAAPFLPEDIRLDGLLHGDMALVATYNADTGLDLQITGDSRLRSYQAGLANPPLDVGGDLTNWQGNIRLITSPEAPLQITGNGKLAAGEMHISDRKLGADLLYLSAIDIPELSIRSLNEIQAKALLLGPGHALVYQKDDAANKQPLVSWQGIDSAELGLKGTAVSIDSIQLKGLNAQVERNKAGEWNVMQAVERSLPAKAAESTEVAVATEPSSDTVQPLRIGRIELSQDSKLSILDATVEPSFTMQLHDLQTHISDINNQQPTQPSPVHIQAAVGDYGKLVLDGQVRPFLTPADAQLKGKISGIDTVPLSGFTRQLLGHRIRQGTVSGDLDINIEQGRLNSSLDLVLNKLQIAAIKGKAGEFEESSGMPLGTALNLMRDRDENIRLTLPITGDMDEPDIDINGIIRKAVFKAVQTAVLTFYSPLGVINVGDKLIQFATALRFDPIAFGPGDTSLSAAATAQLAKLTDVLLQRPKLQISVCAIAAPSDRQVLAENIATANTRLFGLYKPDPEPDAVPEEQLLELTRQRMLAVGDYLGDKGIANERLILCGGEISDDEKAKPVVKIEL